VSGQRIEKAIVEKPHSASVTWGQMTQGHRHASRPPATTKARKVKWTSITASARSR